MLSCEARGRVRHPLGSLGLGLLEHRGAEKAGSLPKRRRVFGSRKGSSLGLKLGPQDKDSRAGWLVRGPAAELRGAWVNRRLGIVEAGAAAALRGIELKHLQRLASRDSFHTQRSILLSSDYIQTEFIRFTSIWSLPQD